MNELECRDYIFLFSIIQRLDKIKLNKSFYMNLEKQIYNL
jgi:hypothetical protein